MKKKGIGHFFQAKHGWEEGMTVVCTEVAKANADTVLGQEYLVYKGVGNGLLVLKHPTRDKTTLSGYFSSFELKDDALVKEASAHFDPQDGWKAGDHVECVELRAGVSAPVVFYREGDICELVAGRTERGPMSIRSVTKKESSYSVGYLGKFRKVTQQIYKPANNFFLRGKGWEVGDKVEVLSSEPILSDQYPEGSVFNLKGKGEFLGVEISGKQHAGVGVVFKKV